MMKIQVKLLEKGLAVALQDRAFVQRALQRRPRGGFRRFLSQTPFHQEVPLELTSLSGKTRTLLLFDSSATARDVKHRALGEFGLLGAHDPAYLDVVCGMTIVDDDAQLMTWDDDIMACDEIPVCTLVQSWQRIVQVDGLQLQHAPDDCKADFDIVIKACGQHGMALEFASEDLREKYAVVLGAVRQNGLSLEFAQPVLQSNFRIVQEAVRQNGMALQFASDDLRQREELALQAVQQNGMALELTFFNWDLLL